MAARRSYREEEQASTQDRAHLALARASAALDRASRLVEELQAGVVTLEQAERASEQAEAAHNRALDLVDLMIAEESCRGYPPILQ